ncbi:mRNA capping enzyme [Neolentinus lepideus HHB14362 ss-1]|uniref:mRNA-capping enzyme subunit alpha n=1 Tax=Neolentinus lepideus HHB14362 ss-1 TaxID=1314782 RepID=A0A165TA88_9AGAM|nr:mRNA capping enzyme [Neolentinus lepideus HHB14362 ss-1]
MPTTPELPGDLVPPRSDQEKWLKRHVAMMCQMDHERFPGSQPVSFGTKDLEKLEKQDYWVCEKSDGVRVLLLVITLNAGDQTVYLIDRHNTYRSLAGLFFPHHENPKRPLRNTLVDGELVLDEDPRTHHKTMRYLAFDCLVVDDQNVMSRPLDKRYGRLQEWFYKPYSKMLREFPEMGRSQPFEIKVKDLSFSYGIEKIFNVDIPALQHGNDGLIYTCVNTPYTPGTDTNILKWKPPDENSIDFKLILRFPSQDSNPQEPNFRKKPIFVLFMWCGDDHGVPRYEPFDVMHVEDEEWERMKASGEQIDERIVEVVWDSKREKWRMLRFRDDKPNGNHRNVVENIIQSIADGVEKEALLARCTAIRNAWKARLGQPATGLPPPPQQAPPSHPPQAPPAFRPPAPPPKVEFRYGSLGPSRWSKVAGPTTIAGMNR